MKRKKTDNAPLVEIAPNQGLRKYDWHVPITDILKGIKLWKKNRANAGIVTPVQPQASGSEECVSGLPKGEAVATEGRKYNNVIIQL